MVVLFVASYISACRKDDPQLNECVVAAGRRAIPYFINGNGNAAPKPIRAPTAPTGLRL